METPVSSPALSALWMSALSRLILLRVAAAPMESMNSKTVSLLLQTVRRGLTGTDKLTYHTPPATVSWGGRIGVTAAIVPRGPSPWPQATVRWGGRIGATSATAELAVFVRPDATAAIVPWGLSPWPQATV